MSSDEGPRNTFTDTVFAAASHAAEVRAKAIELSGRLVGQVPPRAVGDGANSRTEHAPPAIFDDVRNAGQSIQRDLQAIAEALFRIEGSL